MLGLDEEIKEKNLLTKATWNLSSSAMLIILSAYIKL